MKRTISYDIPFESIKGREYGWTLVIQREQDSPTISFGLLWGDKATLTYETELPVEDVLKMCKELTDASV